MRLGRVVLDNAEEILAVVLVMAIAAIMLGQIILRTVFASPLSWPEELSQFLMAWAALLGGLGALKRSELIRVEVIADRIPVGVQRIFAWIQAALIIILLVAFLKGGFDLAGRTQMRAASMPITWYWVYIAAPIFSVAAMVRLIQKTLGYEFVFIGTTPPELQIRSDGKIGQ